MSEKLGGKKLIVTIDGPSGAGKSTVAKMIARSLGYKYIDTGAMYRGAAYAYRFCGVRRSTCPASQCEAGAFGDSELEKFLKSLSIRFEFGGTAKVFLDGEDISEKIRSPEISLLASRLSQNRKVREYLTGKQREIGNAGGVVLEGRDTGSVVFPHAQMKFYLDADHDERAKRRYLELDSKGIKSELPVVKEEMLKRDRDDSEREIAPLIIPENAVYIDTTGLNVKEVVDTISKFVLESGK